ncbi:MAG: ABC transporter permease [Clostridiales bacterium]|nr:ABC transporter permease [Clostridiales bacterium]
MESEKKKNMIWQMAQNDMKARYASSMLGILWIFVLPFITILVFWVVYELGFRNAPISNVPYILWFSCGYIPWLFFTDYLSSGTNCLIEYSYLVKKVKFPVELLPWVKLNASLMIHLFFLLVLFGMFFIHGIRLTLTAIQVLYYSAAMAFLAYALVRLLSAVCVFFKDISQIVNVIIQIGFWATPIIWNLQEMDEAIRKVLKWNPMSYIVEGYRDSLIYHRWLWEKKEETIVFWIFTGVVFVLGRIVFSRLQKFFADEL